MDRTSEELEWMRGYRYDPTASRGSTYVVPTGARLPASIDWREKHAVTTVKQQGQGSSCWLVHAHDVETTCTCG